MQNTFTKRAHATCLNTCLTYTKEEFWSAPWRYLNIRVIVGVIGVGLQTQKSQNLLASKGVCRGIYYDLFILATWSKLEDVGGLLLTTASTTHLPFIHVRHDRHVGNQTAHNEYDRVNSFLPGTSSGWEERKLTKRNCNAIIRKTIENHCRPWFCSCCRLLKLRKSQFIMFKLALVKTSKSSMLFE